MGNYVHQVPGRLRVRIPAIRRNPRRGSDIKSMLNIYGVGNIKVNSLTGGVVVFFDTAVITAQQLLAFLKEKLCYDSTLVVICDDKIQQASDKAAARVGQGVFGYAVGKALEASGLSLLAMLI